MAMNRVRFQPGLSMSEFFERYGTEEKREAALFASRWPSGWCCPVCRCACSSSFIPDGRRYWQCSAHHHQSTLISGTVFEATKLPPTRWFQAMHLLTQAKNNLSALELMRHRGGLLQDSAAHEAQAHGGHAPARRLPPAHWPRRDRRRLSRGRARRRQAWPGLEEQGVARGRGADPRGRPGGAGVLRTAALHQGRGLGLHAPFAGVAPDRGLRRPWAASPPLRAVGRSTIAKSPVGARPAPNCPSSMP